MQRSVLIIIAIALVIITALPRIVKITVDKKTKIFMVWPWSQGNISFVNSVTNGYVFISFRLLWHFSHFSAMTDEATEGYYTSGTYTWNHVLAKESKKELGLCSIKGMVFKLDSYTFAVKNGCLSAEIIWPP